MTLGAFPLSVGGVHNLQGHILVAVTEVINVLYIVNFVGVRGFSIHTV